MWKTIDNTKEEELQCFCNDLKGCCEHEECKEHEEHVNEEYKKVRLCIDEDVSYCVSRKNAKLFRYSCDGCEIYLMLKYNFTFGYWDIMHCIPFGTYTDQEVRNLVLAKIRDFIDSDETKTYSIILDVNDKCCYNLMSWFNDVNNVSELNEDRAIIEDGGDTTVCFFERG